MQKNLSNFENYFFFLLHIFGIVSLLDLNFSMMKYIVLDDQENIPNKLETLVWAMDCIREE